MSGSPPKTTLYHDLPLPIRVEPVATDKINDYYLDGRGERRPPVQDRNSAASAPDDNDRGSEYGVAVSTSDATTAAVRQVLPPAPYVVVVETKDPHHTFSTAQKLPDLSYFGVVGAIGSGDPIDLYRLTLSAGAERLDFELVSGPSVPTVPMQFELFDGTGRVLGEWSLDNSGTPSLHAELGGLPAGSTLYLGITAGNPSEPGGPSAAIDYQLWISVQSTTDGSISATSAAAAVAILGTVSGIASPLATATNPAVQPSTVGAQAAPPVPPNDGEGLRVAGGSPAMRSARPSGGLLSEGDPAPPAARDFSAAADKEWDERSLTRSAPRERNEVELAALSEREREPDALVVIRGPGGFPLIGAVAIGHRGRNPVKDTGDFSTLRGMGDLDRELAVGAVAQKFLANSDIAVTEGGDEARSRALREHPWADFPVSVFSGLGLAIVLTLNAVLSQPIAGFDYLASRMDASGGPRSHRTGRSRKPAAPSHSSSAFDAPPR